MLSERIYAKRSQVVQKFKLIDSSRNHSNDYLNYLIIKESSSFERPLSQRDIMEELNNRYEIKVERKSLSRTIHSLEDENLGITSEKQRGVWYDRYD